MKDALLLSNKLLKNILEFSTTSKFRDRTWIKVDEDKIKIYVRKTQRLIGEDLCIVIDIASIEVNESIRGKKIFKTFIENLELQCEYSIYIESVVNERFSKFFRDRDGWKVAIDCPFSPCFIFFRSNDNAQNDNYR